MIKILPYPLTQKFLYRVKENENLEMIAQKFNVSVEKLRIDNNNIQNIYEGCVLFINTLQTKTYVVKPLDTPESVAKKLGVDKQKLIKDNHITKLFIGQKLEY